VSSCCWKEADLKQKNKKLQRSSSIVSSFHVSHTKKMVWIQKTVTVRAPKRGCHLITDQLTKEIHNDLNRLKMGIAHFFIQHTSASLTINENYDRDVRLDMESSLNHLVPENQSYYRHTLEGSDDMPAHVKATLVGNSVSVPITDGKLNLGNWQGIWLCEHRNECSPRNIVITINGE